MKPNKQIKIAFLISCFIFINACQNIQKKTVKNNRNWDDITGWSFDGKIAINDNINNGSGRIYWEIHPEFVKAQFKAPLGQGNWILTETGKHATLESSKNGESNAKDAEQLITQELGWHFPWKSLQYWVRGYKTGHPLILHDKLPIIINDNGWEITYQKWMDTSLGLMPKKIKATKDNYSMKLIIYNWKMLSK